MGGFEVPLSGGMEPTLKYQLPGLVILTTSLNQGVGQRQVGSLTGAVAS